MINIGPEICGDFEKAASLEWLETNGIGGFASGTVSGANSRRYHGLLTAAVDPPLGRITMLSKFEETLVIDGRRFELSSNRYPDRIFPEGYKYLRNFRLDPFPVWTYLVNGIEIQKTVCMPYGENTVVCEWRRLSGGGDVELHLRPLLSFADYHSLQKADGGLEWNIEVRESLVTIRPSNSMPPLYFGHNGKEVEETGFWYRNFQYSIERERGFDDTEDLFQPFTIGFVLSTSATTVVSTVEHDASRVEELEASERSRRSGLIAQSGLADERAKRLVLAADQFIVKRGKGYTVIAGYPWFSDWGRDTMISLHGLTLTTRRYDVARDILLEFSRHISEGLIPNRFPDAGETPEFNTVDATLWYFEAIRAYVESSGDIDLVRTELYEKLADIVVQHLRGTRHNIHVDTDGLLEAGDRDTQLTWMDAKVGDLVITPRNGKAVEIQALWYNALRIMEEFAARFGDDEDNRRYGAMADLASLSFNALFWNDDADCLFDVVENGTRDGAVRPNQILAVSLPHSMLPLEKARMVVDKVKAELLTPVGLRTLSPLDPAYRPVYAGSPFERDSAYHQGTVWPWLIGPYVDAHRKVYPDDEAVSGILSGFTGHLLEMGLGQIAEIFDGDPPHRPRGCPAQAWSVAELLRVSREAIGRDASAQHP